MSSAIFDFGFIAIACTTLCFLLYISILNLSGMLNTSSLRLSWQFFIILCNHLCFQAHRSAWMQTVESLLGRLNLRECSGQNLNSFPVTELPHFPMLSQTDHQLFLWKIAGSVSLNISRLHSSFMIYAHRCVQVKALVIRNLQYYTEPFFLLTKWKICWPSNSILHCFSDYIWFQSE